MIEATYEITAASTAATGVIGRIPAPDAKRGTVTSITAICTTATTGPVGQVSLGRTGDADVFGKMDIPNASIDDRIGNYEPGYFEGARTGTNPGEVLLVDITAATTLGAATFFITIQWE